MGKHEALSTRKLIQEVLCEQLQIPSEQIVNDTTFSASLKMSRPDILIYDVVLKNLKDEVEKRIFLIICFYMPKSRMMNAR